MKTDMKYFIFDREWDSTRHPYCCVCNPKKVGDGEGVVGKLDDDGWDVIAYYCENCCQDIIGEAIKEREEVIKEMQEEIDLFNKMKKGVIT